VLSDERKDGLVRIRDVDEHTGVTDERGPRRALHQLRPGLVKVAHLPEVEAKDLGRATE
jgi:hypothetical protein